MVSIVDDVKVFTRSKEDATRVVFVINDALRSLHLNLQGSKTEILSDDKLREELDNTDLEKVESVFKSIERIDPDKPANAKQITTHLRSLNCYLSRFRRNHQKVIRKLRPKQNRLLRRLMTICGFCGRPQLKKTAIMALTELPDLRILDKSLSYLSQLKYTTHDEIIDQLFGMLEGWSITVSIPDRKRTGGYRDNASSEAAGCGLTGAQTRPDS